MDYSVIINAKQVVKLKISLLFEIPKQTLKKEKRHCQCVICSFQEKLNYAAFCLTTPVKLRRNHTSRDLDLGRLL